MTPSPDALFAPRWEPAPAPSGAAGPWAVAGPAELTTNLDAPGFVVDTYADRSALADLLAAWRTTATRLVVLTHGAVAAGGYVPTTERAAVWGVARAHQVAHPGRVVLVDADEVTEDVVAAAVASGEDRLALRDGQLLRTTRVEVPPADPPTPAGPVILTGHDHDAIARRLTDPVVTALADIPELTSANPDATVVCAHLSAEEAVALHETTVAKQLALLVFLSSDVATGAVNEALARHRNLLGLPAVSVTHEAEYLAGAVATALATDEPCLRGHTPPTSASSFPFAS